MKGRWLVGPVLAALVFSMATSASAAEGDKIVRTKAGLNGLKVLNVVCVLLNCQNKGALDVLPGESAEGSSLFLVGGLLDDTVNFLLSLLGLATIEPDLQVKIVPETDWGSEQASSHVVDQLYDRVPMTYYGATAWRSYLTQPATSIVRTADTHCGLRATGAGIVAVIDTGVDATHPALAGSVLPGYDFTHNSSDTSEGNGVTQASSHVVDGDSVEWINPSTAATVQQASSHVVDDPDHAAYGHGTMVAGVVKLTSPTAKILPVKAFGPDGTGATSDILRAIYFATRKGAKVINMSFSRSTPSRELKLALDYASLRGVVLVASTGNNGQNTVAYPASYDNVIGVASTNYQDVRSTFSNYGTKVTTLAAPGEAIITPFPDGAYAAASGTSFSTPMVSGAAALIVGIQPNASPSQVTSALSNAKRLTTDLGYGRLSLYDAVRAGRTMWPYGAKSAVPVTCGSDGLDWSEAN
jgi:subtilisin family serine protease